MRRTHSVSFASTLLRWLACAGIEPGQLLPAMRDIAARHRVGISLVARALAILERDGWVDRQHGRGVYLRRVPPMSAGGRSTILFLCLHQHPGDGFGLRVAEGALRSAQRSGASLGYHPLALPVDALVDWVRDRHADGAILAGRIPVEVIDPLRAVIPIALAGSPLGPQQPTTIPWVEYHDREAAYLATQHLLAMGHRRITFVGEQSDFHFVHEHLTGIAEALNDAALPAEMVRTCHITSYDAGWATVPHPDRAADDATALMIGSWELALAMTSHAQRLGHQLGKTVSILCLDDPPADVPEPPFSGFSGNPSDLGEDAMQLLNEAIAGLPMRTALRRRTFVRRGSTGPATAT